MEAEIQARSYNALQLNRSPLLTHRNQTYAVYSECGVKFLQENDSNGSRDAAEGARYSSSKVAFNDRSLREIYKLSNECVPAALYTSSHTRYNFLICSARFPSYAQYCIHFKNL